MKERIIISACVVVVVYGGWRLFTSDLIAGGTIESGTRVLDTETGYRFTIQIGPDFGGWPTKSKDTGRMTGYPAEVCHWNQCGQEKGGTWVVLQQTMGLDLPTQCPKCGHAVVGHNPLPPGTYVDQDGYLQKRQARDGPAADVSSAGERGDR